MPSSNSSFETHLSSDLLPYRCPTCGNGKRFRSLIALRLHTSIVHNMDQPNIVSSQSEDKQTPDNDEESSAKKPFSIDVFLGKSSTPNDKLSNDFVELLSSTPVNDMFHKYTEKVNAMEKTFNNHSKKLEKRLNLAKQLDEIRRQKEELHRIKKAWQAAHGVSQLVQDTDYVIQKTLTRGTASARKVKREDLFDGVEQKVLRDQKTSKYEANMDKQLNLSIQLAAQYKALAISTEEKLKQKIQEEQHLKQYIEATARKEQDAKKKLAEFMESLLQRAEHAESKLELYQSPNTNANEIPRTKHNRYSRPAGTSKVKKPKEAKTNTSFNSDVVLATPRLDDSGIASLRRIPPKGRKPSRRIHDDPYVNNILERPNSTEWASKSRKKLKQQLQDVDTSRLVDPVTIMPFSNYISGAEDSDQAADRRVALFCVFTQLRTIDLLRCSLVCREWRNVSRHHQLWSRIRFHDVNVDARLFNLVSNWSKETCYLCLKNIGLISSQDTSSAGILEESLEMVLRSCGEKLLILSVDQCDPLITSRILWLVSCYNKSICSISYRSSLDPISQQVAWSLGSSCRNIVSLEVAPLQPCSVRGLFTNNVARLLSWCWPQLQALSFGGQDIDGAGLLAVALNCHHLQVLELDHARGISRDQALTVCKHGLKELHTMLFTHTPVLPSTLLYFLKTLKLKSVFVIVAQRDYFTRNKLKKIASEYSKISRALQNIQQDEAYRKILSVECQ